MIVPITKNGIATTTSAISNDVKCAIILNKSKFLTELIESTIKT